MWYSCSLVPIFSHAKLSDRQVNTLADNYLYFLWLYHKSEHEFFHCRNKTIPFDPVVTAERRNDLLNLTHRAVKRGKL